VSNKVLVTGGAGFVGSHVVHQLVRDGYGVKVVDMLAPQVHGAAVTAPRFLAPDIEFVQADLCDRQQWDYLLHDVDAVIHLAAEVGVGQSMYEIVRYVRGNSLATAVLLEALLAHRDQLKKIVVASSMSIYGEGAYHCSTCGIVYPRLRPVEQLQQHEWELRCDRCHQIVAPMPTTEDKPLFPTSIYAVTKRDHEELCLTFGLAYGIPTIALRFFNIYGPFQALSNPYTGVAAIFSSRLLNGKPPLIFEDGRQSRDFVHVSDIVQAVIQALRTETVTNDVFNVGTGRPFSIIDVAESLAQEIGLDIRPEIVNQFRAGDIRHCFADITKIQQGLGYEPRVTFADGVRDLVAWIRNESAVDQVEVAYQQLTALGLAR
jgi:dTDP-L-rhamnose 4-epimerase